MCVHSSPGVGWVELQRQICEEMNDDDEYKSSRSPPQNDLSIEWTYTYDLDNLLFIVDSRAHFSLQGIAGKTGDQWTQFLSKDARGDRCLSLETPLELIGKFECIYDLFLGGDPIPPVEDFIPTSTIPSATWSKPLSQHHRRLMLVQVNAMIAETYSFLYMIPDFETSDPVIQNFVIEFLEAIVPNNHAIVVNRRSPTLDIGRDKAASNQSPWFWYRGCLILLAANLDNNERFQVYVQAVAARAKAKHREKCTALLWSIHHVAVVEISDGSVSCSDPIPLLAAYGFDEEGFMNALHLLWHYLPYPRWRIANEQTSPGAACLNFGTLPAEIIMKIMGFTDQLHYPKYQFLSRSFFNLWWKRLRVGPHTILPDDQEVRETSRCFKAFSVDEDVIVELRLKVLWGIQSGSIWHSDKTYRSGDSDSVWSILYYRAQGGGDDDCEDFSSRGSTNYRSQRFYSYWPKIPPSMNKFNLPRVSDRFSSQTDILICEVEPM